MSEDQPASEGLTARIRRLAVLLNETGLERLRITEANEDFVELRRGLPMAAVPASNGAAGSASTEHLERRAVDTIKSDLVGIARLVRPVAAVGESVQADRELAYVEALGIRNPIRPLGAGKVSAILVADGQPVQYGQALFEIERV